MTIPACGCQLPDGTICSHQVETIVEQLDAIDAGPSVQECAANDRAWDIEKGGE